MPVVQPKKKREEFRTFSLTEIVVTDCLIYILFRITMKNHAQEFFGNSLQCLKMMTTYYKVYF